MRVLVCVAVVSLVLVAGCVMPPLVVECPNAGAAPVELGVEIAVAGEGAQHFPTGTQLSYVANPPASGPHWPSPAAPGVYEGGLEEETWVHNLEHGYVVVLYDCNVACDAGLLEQLRALPGMLPVSPTFQYAKVVVVPYECLPSPAVLTLVAWEVQLHLDQFDEAAIRAFYERYLDQGPELAG